MKRRLRQLSAVLCIALTLTSIVPASPVFAAQASDGVQEDVLFTRDAADDPGLPDGSETPDEPQPDPKPETPAVKKSTVKKAWIVAKKKARINWTKSKGADGYILYRRTANTKKWTKVATLYGEGQTYGYDPKVAKGTYYYTVKAFRKTDGKNAYADFDQKGFKVTFAKNTTKSVSGEYKSGSVYGSKLSAKQLFQVKAAVQKFCDSYITSDMSDVEKVLAAQLYMARTCVYAADWSKNGANTAWGALVYKNSRGYHEAQCSGFARGMKALCDGIDVDCRYVHANAKSLNPSHQWVEVKIGKKWYIVDPQANASSGFLAFFLCSGQTYTSMSGMTWDKGSYPKVSGKDYPAEKINEAWYGYKITKVYNKLSKLKLPL